MRAPLRTAQAPRRPLSPSATLWNHHFAGRDRAATVAMEIFRNAIEGKVGAA